ncbi:VOC family protein [Actinacidiphila sp. ITFR-21]|uniref:VOC family protein n=1 Tax=Actinacidiphila sp. ITFR-21 TaxID=3075199 RepID=UPI00288AD41A|nr:VOC family protein [Streptomyces sp. ITFR-21]WNI15942.1 VOC family protein [Streptomyces sp. ITFR-21]
MSGISEGAPCWADVALPDPDAGKRFYGELFGWTFQDQGEEFGHYAMALRDGRNAAALAGKMNASTPTAWSVYLASSDIGKTAVRIREAGGQIVFGPDAVGDSGAMMGVIDPGGSYLGVWQPGSHTGFGVVNEPGGFSWTENLTREVDTVDTFYTRVFGYDTQQVGDGAHFDYQVYSPPGDPEHPVGGRMRRAEDDPAGPADAGSAYRVYFAVEDCDAAAATVRRLGGRVLQEPRDSPFGRMAVVADDQGARFAVIDTTRRVGEAPAR